MKKSCSSRALSWLRELLMVMILGWFGGWVKSAVTFCLVAAILCLLFTSSAVEPYLLPYSSSFTA